MRRIDAVRTQVLAMAAVVVVAACGPRTRSSDGAPAGDSLSVTGAFSYAPPSGETVAVYFTIHNPGPAPDTLVHVNTPDAAGVSYHRSVTDGDLVRMESMSHLTVGPADSTVLSPGGLHLMLTSSRRRAPGDTIHMSLSFSRAGTRVVLVPVLAPGDEPAGHGAHQDH